MGVSFMPLRRHSVMIRASGTFCQKMKRQERCSTYQPSSEAEMLRLNSKLSAYSAMPKAQYLGGVFTRMKPKVRGMKKPEATPLANCSMRSIGSDAAKPEIR